MPKPEQLKTDFVIAGAGVIGLTLALELHVRGATVVVLDRYAAMRQASFAASGMLAACDPHNPLQLAPLSELSISLYPTFLARLESLGGLQVPFQTSATLQYLSDGSKVLLDEQSIDPRQLAGALLAAVQATSIVLHRHVGRTDVTEDKSSLTVRTTSGLEIQSRKLVHANGAWFQGRQLVLPRKGQLLRVVIPPSLRLREVHRAENVYIVPRTEGPQAGSAIIGATVEDAGFDLSTHDNDLDRLRSLAAQLIPALACKSEAPMVEAWAGIRPATADGLPLIGQLHDGSNQLVATGHFRNGILLAPATAHVVADLLEEKAPAAELRNFAVDRFRTVETIFGQAS